MKKIVRETLIEGVADIYGEKEFFIDKPYDEFEEKYKKQRLLDDNKEEIIGDIGQTLHTNLKCLIVKNPKSLENFVKDCRGVITKNGNLYLAQNNAYNHSLIIEFLGKKGILNPKEIWYKIDPKNNYITVQRYLLSNKIYLGESNQLPKLKSKSGEVTRYKILEEHFKPYLNNCKLKNPQFEFILEMIYNIQ